MDCGFPQLRGCESEEAAEPVSGGSNVLPRYHILTTFPADGRRVGIRQPGLWLSPLFMGCWAWTQHALHEQTPFCALPAAGQRRQK